MIPEPKPKFVHYPSLSAWRAALALPKMRGCDNMSDTAPATDNWDFSAGWDGAEHMATVGWSEGATAVRALADKLRDALEPPEMMAPGYEVAPYGPDVALDMGRFVDGDPEHWRINVPAHGGHVCVGVSLGAFGGCPAEELQRRCAAGLAVAWVLHDAGYEVDLRGIDVTATGRGASFSLPLEPYLAAYWIGHPASLRRHWFRWLENNHPDESRGGYGAPSREQDRKHLPPGAIYVESLDKMSDKTWRSDESALSAARKLLGSLGSLDPTH